jgi:hypothetical protein
MRSPALRAALLGAALALLLVAPANAARAARLTSSAATTAAERVAERYADATNADEDGVDSCERRSRTVFACDLFVTITVDDETERSCTAGVTVRSGKRRSARPAVSAAHWTCEEVSLSGDEGDEADGEDEPVDGGEDAPAEDEGV